MKFKLLILLVFISLYGYSQEVLPVLKNGKKGEFFLYWGYNWDWYSTSDIHFEGDDYNFELHKVVAKDNQTDWSFERYFYLGNLTLPQYNLRLGYYFSDHYSVSLGIDHMKYVVQEGQTTQISGYIGASGSPYEGVYDNDNIVIEEGFLEFEHTDGLNYINAEVRRFDELYSFHKNIQLNMFVGAGFGGLYPKTNTTLISKERYDEFHLAGWGAHLLLGVNVTFFRHLFLQTELKGGFINMPDIRTTQSPSDRASQHFFFGQYNINLGGTINFLENKKKKQKV
ncbi:MAG: hypothetical protein QM499_08930 [Flavobacteriaceae bacterium]